MTAARQAREQLVAIVGPTGVGKSELGVLLAAQHAPRAVIVNTDAMQLYAGLDVITNKLPMNERVGVEHKLISHVDPFTTSQLVIADFERDALREIEQAHDDGKLAFALGGTAYYTQHLLFPGRLVSSAATSGPASHDGQAELDPKETDAAFISRFSDELQARLASLEAHELALLRNVVSLPALSSPSATLSLQSGSPTLSSLIPSAYLATSSLRDVSDDSDGPGGGKDKLAVSDLSAWLYALLTKLDPQGAARWHWRDVRKVRRALELIILRRTTWAEVLQDQDRQIGLSPASRQREDAGASGSTGAAPARFDTLVLWLWAEQEALSKRLDERVERMLDAGLLAEVAAMRAARRRLIGDGEAGTEEDFTTGIWQAIGYRQFVPYLEALEQRGQPLPAAQATSEEEDAELAKLLREGIEQTQLATRQYAKRQLKWIRSKLARAINDANQLAAASSGGNGKSCELVLLDATDLAQWRTRVFEPAKVALDAFSNGKAVPESVHDSLSDAARAALLAATSDMGASAAAPQNSGIAAAAGSGMRALVQCDICSGLPCAPRGTSGSIDSPAAASTSPAQEKAARPFLVEQHQWEAHVRSRAHKKRAANARTRQAQAQSIRREKKTESAEGLPVTARDSRS